MKFVYTYTFSGASHIGLANAPNEFAVHAWLAMYKPNSTVLNISKAREDAELPDVPTIDIEQNFFEYLRVAQNINAILQYTNRMSCRFYVMDEEYMGTVAYPELSRDNRGNMLMIGDWYVIVRCPNGYLYYVNVTHDSVVTMCAEVFKFIQNK